MPTNYGFCPICGAQGVARERRPGGNDKCKNGCTYPSRNAVRNILKDNNNVKPPAIGVVPK